MTARPLAVTAVIQRYLALKQALGRRYDVERDVLRHLEAFLRTQRGRRDLTPGTFAQWCLTHRHRASGVRRNRMRIVRNLCLYRRRTDAACFVPDARLFPPNHQRRRPHIFSEAEIAHLLTLATALTPTLGSPLRAETYRLALVLLYTAGLRRGELTRLQVGDYDRATQVLLVRASKFHKSRLVPLSSDAAAEVVTYLQRRRRAGFPSDPDTPLLWHRTQPGAPYTGAGLAQGLRRLFRQAGVAGPRGQGARVHDMRHTFAVHALSRWYRAGLDVQSKLPALAAYLGHVSIVSTALYLHFVDPVPSAASARFAERYGRLIEGGPTGGAR
jgi:site-specific recombinase XerD